MTRLRPSPAIRSAQPGDAAQIARIKVAGWRFAYRDLLPADLLADLDVRKTTAQWRRIIEQNAGSLAIPRVAHLQPSPIIGFLQASCLEGGGARISTLYLDPMHVGTGAGHALMMDASDRLRAAGCRWAELWVLEGNHRAIGFYRRHGWELTGETRQEHVGRAVLRELRMRLRWTEASESTGPRPGAASGH